MGCQRGGEVQYLKILTVYPALIEPPLIELPALIEPNLDAQAKTGWPRYAQQERQLGNGGFESTDTKRISWDQISIILS